MYAPQPEIKKYLQHCARKYGLMAHMQFGQEVKKAIYDEKNKLWRLETAAGKTLTARMVVSGMGGLSTPAYPNIKGIENFKGKAFHSQDWQHDYPLEGKRVAVIGTGASAIQFVPQIVPKVAHLDLYQRTPPWIMPKPDRSISSAERALFKLAPKSQEAVRNAIYLQLESRVLGFVLNPRVMKIAELQARRHIRKSIKDPVLRKKVTPDYTFGCKRVLISNDYLPSLAQSNVDVLTQGIKEVKAHSIVGDDGVERPVDTIIYGTGFKAQDPIPRGAVFGKNGVDLIDTWQQGVDIAGRYSPTFGALLQTTPTALGVLMGYKPAMQTGRQISNSLGALQQRAIANASAPRTLNTGFRGQRGAVGVLDNINPTGKVFTEYDPKSRANGILAKNIVTIDKTMGGSPDDYVLVYRGAPKNQTTLNSGDFVTTNKQLAKDYAGDGVVISQKVKKSEILDDINEPLGEEYIYKRLERPLTEFE